MQLSPLTAISPIDGRYDSKTEALRSVFSEYALMRFRLIVEIRWFEALAEEKLFTEIKPLDKKSKLFLNDIIENFNEADAKKIKNIERKINHDVKAVEYFLKEKFSTYPELAANKEFIHFACTSEDINNLAYALMLKTARQKCLAPLINEIITIITRIAHEQAAQPMLARTHGQPATPTTLGKEFANIVMRLKRQRDQLLALEVLGKCNGATGNFNAHVVAYPKINWLNLSKRFITQLGLVCNEYTTQIEPHDFIAEWCHTITRFNTILIDTARDVWNYISLNYFKLKMKSEEVGSSTMPHKVNPIDFENAEGNLSLANALFQHLSSHLPRSRWQRDLRDSTLLRNLGVAFAHSIIAYQAFIQGLQKLAVAKDRIEQDLMQHWEILAEAIQTVLRRYRAELPYEQLKKLTRGKTIDQHLLQQFIQKLDLPADAKNKLLELTPMTYVGMAVELAQKV